MKRLALFILLACTAAHAQKQWTVEDIFRNGGPTGTPPHGIQWSPDGKLLTFLAPDNTVGKTGDLLALDAVTGKLSVLATQDKLIAAPISEKDKDHRARYGMPSYTWAADSKHLILDAGGVISLYDIASQTSTRIVDTQNGSGDDPKFSPDAKTISYLRNHNLYVAPAEPNTHKELNLTNTSGEAILNGEVDWVYLEELEVRSNYFWSPDSEHIAYLQADETKVPEYPLTNLSGPHATVDMQRYPQPGDPNPSVRIGIVSARGGKTKWLDIPQSPGNDYIPRFGWIDAHTLYVELLTRDQKHQVIYLADARSDRVRKIFDIGDAKYLDTNYEVVFPQASNIENLITLRSSSPHILLYLSWQSGHTQLYRGNFDLACPRNDACADDGTQLTHTDAEVTEILGVDMLHGIIFYMANDGHGSALYQIHTDGSGQQRISPADGAHSVILSSDFTHFAAFDSTTLSPPALSLCDLASQCTTLWQPRSPSSLGYTPITPQTLQLKAADKKTTLYATLTLPPNVITGEKIPVILNPYGGPHDQSVTDAWGGPIGLFNQLLAQHGFAVLVIDNRGMGGRGRDFEQAAYQNFGPIQLEDQLAALDQVLQQFPQLNPDKVGIWGWSWGASLTLYSMEHSDRFKTGIAVAPVTDWRLYDSIYTERYLGLPSDNANANAKIYDADATAKSAAQLKGKLLLIHGTGDDNVHLANSIQQQQALMDAHIPFDLQLYPNKTHSIAGTETRIHLFNRILQYFETNLK